MSEDASIPLPEDQRRFAETLIEEGEYDSLGAVIAAGIDRLRAEHAERGSAMDGLAEELRRRAATPDSKFEEHREGDFLKMLEEDIEERLRRST